MVTPDLHSSADPRLPLYFDAIFYALQVAKGTHAALHPACCTITDSPASVVLPLTLLWSFVDSVHRIRDVSQSIPGLSRKNDQLRDFLDATRLVEEYRHYIQHLRGELKSSPPSPHPVWGSLSWVDNRDASVVHTAVIGSIGRDVQYASCVFDTRERRWTSLVTLGVGDTAMSIDEVDRACEEFEQFVIPWLISHSAIPLAVPVRIPVLTAKIQLTAAPSEHLPS
jgi:hypothetical protein